MNEISSFKKGMTNENEVILDNKSMSESIVSDNENEPKGKEGKEGLLLKFKQDVDFEIKRIFKTYINKEKELYLQVNSHLHSLNSYNDYDCAGLINEMSDLIMISEFALSLESYVNINCIALKNVLRIFDSKFLSLYGRISTSYLENKLEGNNSDLLYLLQFKMIDETSAILDYLNMILFEKFSQAFEKYVHQKKEENKEMISEQWQGGNNELNINGVTSDLNQTTLNLITTDNDFNRNNSLNNKKIDDFDIKTSLSEEMSKESEYINIDNLKKSEIKRLFLNLSSQLEENIIRLDEHSQSFKVMFGDWNLIIKKRINLNISSYSKKDTYNYLMFSRFDENIIDYQRIKDCYRHPTCNDISKVNYKRRSTSISQISSELNEEFISSKASKDVVDNEKFSIEENFSSGHMSNIVITYINLVLSVMSIYSIYPTIPNYILVKSFPSLEIINIAWILIITTTGFLFGNIILSRFSIIKYKHSVLLSFSLLSLGNILYCYNSLIAICFSRFLIGLGSYKISGKSYLIEYLPERLHSKYLSIYQVLHFISIGVGFLISTLCCLYKDYYDFLYLSISYQSLSSFIFFCLSFILFFISLIFYSEPTETGFSLFKSTCEAQLTKSLTFININKSILSKQEIEMIDEIDSRLYAINNENNYSDTNLVQKSIIIIVEKEKDTFGFTKKNYFILLFLLILTKAIFESSLILSPLIAWFNPNELNNDLIHAALMTLAIFFMISVSWILNLVFKNKVINEKVFLFWNETLSFIFLIFALLTWSFIETMWVGFFLLIASSCISEALITNLLIKIIPIYYDLLCIKADNVISSISAISNIISGLIIYILCFKMNEHGEKVVFSILIFLKIVSFVICLIWKDNFRVKAITKLIKQRKELRDLFI